MFPSLHHLALHGILNKRLLAKYPTDKSGPSPAPLPSICLEKLTISGRGHQSTYPQHLSVLCDFLCCFKSIGVLRLDNLRFALVPTIAESWEQWCFPEIATLEIEAKRLKRASFIKLFYSTTLDRLKNVNLLDCALCGSMSDKVDFVKRIAPGVQSITCGIMQPATALGKFKISAS